MERNKNAALIAGAGFIVLGLAIYFLRDAEIGLGRGYITILAGGLMLIGYFWTKSDWFLVPGCLLLAFGIGSIGDRSFLDWDRGDLVPLGLGFLAMPVIHYAYERKVMIWPLVPGLILVGLGFTYLERWLDLMARNWPLILVVIGALVILSVLFKRSAKSSP